MSSISHACRFQLELLRLQVAQYSRNILDMMNIFRRTASDTTANIYLVGMMSDWHLKVEVLAALMWRFEIWRDSKNYIKTNHDQISCASNTFTLSTRQNPPNR